MTIHKITTPNPDLVSFIGSESDATRRTWIVQGVAYTDSESVLAYAERRQFGIDEVDGVPADYLTAVAHLEAYPVKSNRYGTHDGADAESKYRFTGKGGKQVDVRDVIAGRATPTTPIS